MQRWHVTVLCGAAAVVAAVLAPDLVPATTTTAVAPPPAPTLMKVVAPTTGASASGAGLDVRVAMDQSKLLADTGEERFVVVTLEGHETDTDPKPVNVAVVLDSSGSMGAEGKMDYAKRAVGEVLMALDEDDTVSFVTFSDRADVVLRSTPVLDPDALIRHVLSVSEGGGTNLYAGLSEGYTQARRAADGEAVDRVMLLSDGRANLGITDPGELASLVSAWTERGFSVSTLGLGLDYNEDLMATLADRGGGSYHFVDDPTKLQAMFQDELHRAQALAAGGVSVTLSPRSGVEILDVLAYDHITRGGGERVLVGDVHASQTRKVVAKIRVSAAAAGERDLLDVHVSQRDADTIELGLSALTSADAAEVAASVDADVAALAAQADAAVLSDQATKAYEKGDTARMRSLIEQSLQRAASAASAYDSVELKQMESSLKLRKKSFDSAARGSAEALYQVKRAKEADRNAAY